MKKNFPFYILTFSIFLLIISPFIFSRGMFVDGIVYANFSKNYAIGEASFLHPFFSETYLLNFNSHPPMFFFLQGQAFKIFGTSFLVERFYSIICIVITGIITMKIYKKLDLKTRFLPLFFLISIPLITWSATNNIIENTLIIFTTLSALFYLSSLNNKRFIFVILAGISLAIGFTIKGFVAFFPLSLPFIYWLVIRKTKFKRMFFDTIIIIIFSVSPILISMYSSTEVMDYFTNYFNKQIIGGLQNTVTTDYRFYIVVRFLRELIIPIIIIILFDFILRWKRKTSIFNNKENNRKALMMFLFSLTGVLPILVSMKQSGFYLLPAFPFAAIAFSALIDENINNSISKINQKSKGFSILKYISIFILIISISFPFLFFGEDSRDKKMLSDMDIIASYIPQKSIVNVPSQMSKEYSLFAYYARFHNISINPNLKINSRYLLVSSECNYNFKEMKYRKVYLKTQSFNLYEKEN
ncbi:MAG: glycosyltransferase family 39 protein [Bacteroidales bacterium]